MKWLLKAAWRETRATPFQGLVMLFSMVFGLTVLVSFSTLRQGFRESFYDVANLLSGGDLRVEITGQPSERLRLLLPRLGDEREAYLGVRLQQGERGADRDGMLWMVQVNPPVRDPAESSIIRLPELIPVQVYATPEQRTSLFASSEASESLVFPAWDGLKLDVRVSDIESEILPVWMKRIKAKEGDRLYANTPWIEPLLREPGVVSEQVWTYQLDGVSSRDRIARARFILGYIQEEAYGVRLIHELPTETAFYRSFELISNTLFLAAFSALMLGTLAYTVTFISFARGRTNQVALLRCLGSSMWGAWAVFGLQVIGYAGVAVILAAGLSIGMQLWVPEWIGHMTGITFESTIYWRTLTISLLFGGCFMLLPGFVAVLPLWGCEPVEVLRSVKMPARRKQNQWKQAMLIAITALLAVAFCIQMVEETRFVFAYLAGVSLVFGGLIAGVILLRRMIKRGSSALASYAFSQSAANLFRSQNQYVFTLTAMAFGLFIISFLYMFFKGFAAEGIHEISGYGNIPDERIESYLDWLQQVFFLNQWLGVLILVIGLIAVFILLTAQRPSRLYEAVILATLGAEEQLIHRIALFESILAGLIPGLLGTIAGVLAGWMIFGVMLGLSVTLPWITMLAMLSGTVLIMVVMGLANTKDILGSPPIEVLRRRRHFSNW